MNINELIKLPIYLQIVLGGGFIAYMIAMHGRRKDEKAIDLLFGVIAFSLPGLFLWMGLQSINTPELIGGFLVVLYSALVGLLWRKWLRRMIYEFMYQSSISLDEGYKTTWQRIIQDTEILPTQIFVTLNSGKVLGCSNVQGFNDAAIPTWSIDDDGNIGIYVTHIDGEPTANVRGVGDGDMLTYIPASEVYTVGFRFKKS